MFVVRRVGRGMGLLSEFRAKVQRVLHGVRLIVIANSSITTPEQLCTFDITDGSLIFPTVLRNRVLERLIS